MTYVPQNTKSYIGNQIIINSDRLIFNAKTDSILLFSDKAIGFSTNGSFHFDTSKKDENKFVVNSPNIYLGLEFDDSLPVQPAVLADDLIVSLEEILELIENVYTDIAYQITYRSTYPAGTPTAMNPSNNSIVRKRFNDIDRVRQDLQDIKSKNTKLV